MDTNDIIKIDTKYVAEDLILLSFLKHFELDTDTYYVIISRNEVDYIKYLLRLKGISVDEAGGFFPSQNIVVHLYDRKFKFGLLVSDFIETGCVFRMKYMEPRLELKIDTENFKGAWGNHRFKFSFDI